MLRNREWRLVALYAVVFIPNLVSLLLGQAGYDLTWLWASRSTPWGVITANFVPPDLENFVLDMGLLALFLWGFGVVNRFRGGGASKRTERFLSGAVFLSAILAIAFLVALGGHGSGASGVVYATAGLTFGFTLFHLRFVANRVRGWGNLSRSDSANLYVFLFGLVVGPIAAVFGGGNAIVHVVSYCLGGLMGAEIGRHVRSG